MTSFDDVAPRVEPEYVELPDDAIGVRRSGMSRVPPEDIVPQLMLAVGRDHRVWVLSRFRTKGPEDKVGSRQLLSVAGAVLAYVVRSFFRRLCSRKWI